MTYAAQEVTAEDGAPTLLFLFTQGSSTWRLTNHATALTLLSQSWLSAAITVSRICQSGEMAKNLMTVKLPSDHSLSATFLGGSPDVSTSLTIYRSHLTDLAAEAIVVWKGRVVRSMAAGRSVSLECEPVFSSLRRQGLTQTYSRTCRHALFGAGCRLAAASFAVAVNVVSVSGVTVGIDVVPGLPDLTGGTFKAPDGTVRMIVRHVGVVLTLMRPIRSLAAEMVEHPTGFAATVYRGCDKSPSTCRDTFANLANFGGFPGIPRVNPWGANAF